MTRKEELKQRWAEVESDLAALGIGKQIIREERNEAFEDKWLPRFKHHFEENFQYIESLFCWRITANGDIYDYYPKANKVHIHKNNVWHKPGLKFLIKKFLSEK